MEYLACLGKHKKIYFHWTKEHEVAELSILAKQAAPEPTYCLSQQIAKEKNNRSIMEET